MSRFANLADPIEEGPKSAPSKPQVTTDTASSRIGRKAISGYFSPELSMALHHCARKHELSPGADGRGVQRCLAQIWGKSGGGLIAGYRHKGS
jgi:hypothetical protein